MKKILFLSMVATLILASKSFAQQNALVAVLTHEGTNTTFHGAGALAEANEAAVDGDVITLSGGTFNEVTISKGITIRGAGMYRNDSTDVDRTHIPTLTIADSTKNATIENLYLPWLLTGKALEHVNFYKVLVSRVCAWEGCDMTLVNCKIFTRLYCTGDSRINVFNSIVFRPHVDSDNTLLYCQNCVIVYHDAAVGGDAGENTGRYTYPRDYTHYASFSNCIICNHTGDENIYPATVTAKNNIGIKSNTNNTIFSNVTNQTNKYDNLSIFKNRPNNYFNYEDSLTHLLGRRRHRSWHLWWSLSFQFQASSSHYHQEQRCTEGREWETECQIRGKWK